MEDKDNPAFAFSGETKDWPAFKDVTQLRDDKHDTTWLFEGGQALAEFFARQLKEKTGTEKKTRKKALEREKAESDSNHVPTSVDAYTDAALKEWFEDKDIATGLQFSTLKWACLPNLPEGFCKNSLPHRSQPKYAQFQSVGIKDKLNTRALQLAQLTPPS